MKLYKVKLITSVTIGAILSATLFGLLYSVSETIKVASTGYNAISRGLFEWYNHYAVHDFVIEGQMAKGILVDSKTTINYDALLKEVTLCGSIGFGCGILITYLLWRGLPPTGESGPRE